MAAPVAFFEHVALVVHLDDLLAWARYLRGELGGSRSLGGFEPRIGFQGGQITYPDGGMLEVLSWTEGQEATSPNARYLERLDARAAVHHLTFLVDDLDAALEHTRAAGYEPMVGRRGRHWNEFFVRERALRPRGLLIQVLHADKEALTQQGWRSDWAPWTTPVGEPRPPVHVRGVRLPCSDRAAAERLFTELLGATRDGDALAFEGSTMQVWLDADAPPLGAIEISDARDAPPSQPELFRAAK